MYFFPSIYIDSSIEYTFSNPIPGPHRKHNTHETVSPKARILDPHSRDPSLTTNNISPSFFFFFETKDKFIAFKRTTNIIVLPKSVPSTDPPPLSPPQMSSSSSQHHEHQHSAEQTRHRVRLFSCATSRIDRRRPENIPRLRIACPGHYHHHHQHHLRTTTTTAAQM